MVAEKERRGARHIQHFTYKERPLQVQALHQRVRPSLSHLHVACHDIKRHVVHEATHLQVKVRVELPEQRELSFCRLALSSDHYNLGVYPSLLQAVEQLRATYPLTSKVI